MNNNDILKARAYYYEFLAFCFFFCQDEKSYAKWMEQANFLATSPFNENCDFTAILNSNFDDFCAEQNSVLFDLSYANVPLTASFYDEGRDSGLKRMKAIEILKASKYRPNKENFSDCEDFVGFLFLLMTRFLKDFDDESAKRVFSELINDFIDELCELLNAHSNAKIFKTLSVILMEFISLEREYYNLKAPAKKAVSVAKTAMAKRPHVSKMPTPKSKLNWDEFTAL